MILTHYYVKFYGILSFYYIKKCFGGVISVNLLKIIYFLFYFWFYIISKFLSEVMN